MHRFGGLWDFCTRLRKAAEPLEQISGEEKQPPRDCAALIQKYVARIKIGSATERRKNSSDKSIFGECVKSGCITQELAILIFERL